MLAEREWLVNLEATDRQTDGQPNGQSSDGDEALEDLHLQHMTTLMLCCEEDDKVTEVVAGDHDYDDDDDDDHITESFTNVK